MFRVTFVGLSDLSFMPCVEPIMKTQKSLISASC